MRKGDKKVKFKKVPNTELSDRNCIICGRPLKKNLLMRERRGSAPTRIRLA